MKSDPDQDTSYPVNESFMEEPLLNTVKLSSVECKHDPFDYVVVPGFVQKHALDEINHSYPDIKNPGSFLYQKLTFGPAFQSLTEELQGPAMKKAIEKVFNIDLTGRPTTLTIRGQCQKKDGRIHRDSIEKIITVLIYMNSDWEGEGGRLRLLRSRNDIKNYAVEVPPDKGTLIAFRRAHNSWHGHQPFVGPRRVIQLNWVTDKRYVKSEERRHAVSGFLKKLGF